jgi:hypothetical protein
MGNKGRLAGAGLMLLAALPSAADVFKCKQANGQLAYQDHPCGPGAQRAGTVDSGYAAPAPAQDGDSGAAHYQNYLDMVDREKAQRQAERRQAEYEDRTRPPEPMQADQRDYRVHMCQAQLSNEQDHHRYVNWTCDANGNRVRVP